MRILVDVDGVLADLVGALCARLGNGLTPEHFTSYDFADVLPPKDLVRAWGAMCDPGFVLSLPDYPDELAFIQALKDMGGEVVAVTKPFAKSPFWAWERQRWLNNIGIEKVIHTSEKHMVRGDVLIEDDPKNIEAWLEENPDEEATATLIHRPWNQAFRESVSTHPHPHLIEVVK